MPFYEVHVSNLRNKGVVSTEEGLRPQLREPKKEKRVAALLTAN
jgi:hypothetical protein